MLFTPENMHTQYIDGSRGHIRQPPLQESGLFRFYMLIFRKVAISYLGLPMQCGHPPRDILDLSLLNIN